MGEAAKRFMIVVDMQNDFISGALGTEEARSIVKNVRKKLESFEGSVIFTRDTHRENYLNTAEGKKLPVSHCIYGSWGWEICDELKGYTDKIIDKPSFGSVELMEYIQQMNELEAIDQIVLVGLCTDICVISNALLLKAALPEVEISVDASCCAGVTAESHKTALSAMNSCHINIWN